MVFAVKDAWMNIRLIVLMMFLGFSLKSFGCIVMPVHVRYDMITTYNGESLSMEWNDIQMCIENMEVYYHNEVKKLEKKLNKIQQGTKEASDLYKKYQDLIKIKEKTIRVLFDAQIEVLNKVEKIAAGIADDMGKPYAVFGTPINRAYLDPYCDITEKVITKLNWEYHLQ